MKLTEKEWLSCANPIHYFAYLNRSKTHGHVATDRKIRLLRVACCRRIWRLIDSELCRNAVEIVEPFADGPACAHRAWLTRTAVRQVVAEYPATAPMATARDRAVFAAVLATVGCLVKRKLGWDLSYAAGALALETTGPGDAVHHGSRK